ncbi:MAG: 23S rRNA (adenine(2030)-N(6))-methyltransferase RlmJ [Pseudomonadota bacterium]
MNYRHAFHAGNHGDVLKHAVLVRLVEYLKRKDKAFRVIDTHAGRGLYDLADEAAERSGEWRDGVARLLGAAVPAEARALLAPYFDIALVGAPRTYRGSPRIVRELLRPHDRLTAIDLHPDDHLALADHFYGDRQVRVLRLDGWLAMKGHLPPKERRGLIFVDPPFERPGEFERFATHLGEAHRRFSQGVYAFWYPTKDRAAVQAFYDALRELGIDNMIALELTVGAALKGSGMVGSGMVIVNPPYTLGDELDVILPALCAALGQDDNASWCRFWLVEEGALKR